MNYILIAVVILGGIILIFWIWNHVLSAWLDGSFDAERSRFTNTRTFDNHAGIWRSLYEIAYKRTIEKYALNQQRNDERKP